MKNILVPVDFSKSSKGALNYARDLAIYLKANIKVVHMTHPAFDSTNPYMPAVSLEYAVAKEPLLDEFINENTDSKMEDVISTELIDREVVLGFAAPEIINFSKSDDVDLIVMGTTGEGGVFEKLFGTVSIEVAQKTECPVIFVPEGKEFDDYNNIVYASNYESADESLLEQISKFVVIFDTAVHLVHVNESTKKGDYKFEEHILGELFKNKKNNLPIKLITVQSDSVWSGLNQYARDQKIDLIVMASLHRRFWESLTHKSVIKAMLLHAQIPIMILPVSAK